MWSEPDGHNINDSDEMVLAYELEHIMDDADITELNTTVEKSLNPEIYQSIDV